jgi:hypothetical protein
MEYTYAAEIYNARIAVVLLVTNNGGAKSWGDRLIAALPSELKLLKTKGKPLLIRVARDGHYAGASL